ncbi:hypothetical protein M5X66_13110 [Providencia sp. PROV188]|uniref:hypothetical protein n=1 Tax=Providencia TaxID=586 RepID=UPI0022DD8987|nr:MULTISPECIES: hypothetical protein [Providencia]MDL9986217.1 hypothetical protein [Providencia rettgeri]WBM59925.1 hypothetical protein M5X66_13110 [Providencia sp. PROV188]WOC03190.1 hypothetical protein P3L56_15440 [Providencia sp. PROV024]
MATLIDTLLVSLKLDSASFAADAKNATNENDRLSKSIDSLNDVLGDVNETLKGTKEQQKKAKEQTDEFAKSVNNGIKALATLFSTILVSSGLQKLIDDTAKANDQLNFMSKNLGVNATTVKRWQGAAEMAGGSAEGMAASMGGLSKSLWDLATMGDTSILPYFNALNVGVMKNSGELRNLDDILLDVADSLSQMSRPQAYNFAKNMGFDEGTINMLLQGRKEVEEYLALQKDIVVSSEQELEISRQLNKQNALVGQQWEGLKTLLANYVIPYALKFSELVSGFLNYLNKNRDTAVMVFKAMGAVIGITLIPLVLKAATAFLGMFGAIGLMPAALLLLAGGLWLLYDDFKKWKEGGESLLGEYWKKWDSTITPILKKLEEFEKWFKKTEIGKWFTDQEGNLDTWKVALGGFALWFGTKWAASLLATLGKVTKGIKGVGVAAGNASKLAKGAGMIGATYIGAELVDEGLNKLFGKYDAYQRARTAPTWGYFWDSFSGGGGDAYWKDGKWIDNRGKGNGQLLSSDTLDIPTGDVTRDSLAARVTRGELSLDQANEKLVGGKSDDINVSSKYKDRGLRYNSPLNLAYAKQKGASNDGNGWAKFDSPYDGIRASSRQLMMYYNGTSAAAEYKKLQTVWDIIHQWAPKGHGDNDPAGYSKIVADRMGVGVDSVLDLNNPTVMHSLIKEMSKVENSNKYPYSDALSMAAIQGTGDPIQNAISNIQSFNKQISTPFAAGVSGLAKGFLDQSNALKSQAQTITNNKTDVNVGGITVHTTASTLSGVNESAAEEATRRVYQLVPTMN